MASPRGLRQGSVRRRLTAGIATRGRAGGALPPSFLRLNDGRSVGPARRRAAPGGSGARGRAHPRTSERAEGTRAGRGGAGEGAGLPAGPAPPSAPRPRAARPPPAGAVGPDGEHVGGDRRLPADHLRLGAGVVHAAHRLLEGVFHRRHGHHHRHLLGQPLEDLRDRLHRRLQLQGLPVHAGSRRSDPAAPRPGSPGRGTPSPCLRRDRAWGRAGRVPGPRRGSARGVMRARGRSGALRCFARCFLTGTRPLGGRTAWSGRPGAELGAAAPGAGG